MFCASSPSKSSAARLRDLFVGRCASVPLLGASGLFLLGLLFAEAAAGFALVLPDADFDVATE